MRTIMVFLCFLVVSLACRKSNSNQLTCSYVPSFVDTTVNINDLSLITLKTRGYAYLKGGYRGIVIHKESDAEYKAFERASSYRMADVGCPVVVDSTAFFMVDPCSNSKFDFEGMVLQGPAVCPLLEYRANFIGSDRLRIYYSL